MIFKLKFHSQEKSVLRVAEKVSEKVVDDSQVCNVSLCAVIFLIKLSFTGKISTTSW